jgi:hypothetical protein
MNPGNELSNCIECVQAENMENRLRNYAQVKAVSIGAAVVLLFKAEGANPTEHDLDNFFSAVGV